MASTLDLDRLSTLAAWSAAKVVLVGDPGQIGVVRGPGGMLAALAHAGHGVELTAIHRFSQSWERAASLRLRDGDACVLGEYTAAGRVHPCVDGDAAVDAVYAHWSSAREAGQEALMMARTRTDVDALNARVRAAAQAAGDVQGPAARLGLRDWQAGDVLRTRRNDRRLPVGDSHVRNGDCYRVVEVRGPAGGLIVEDLTGRGRTVLPADYVADHAEYGWAATIDAAQGATTDVGIVLVRPGLDREHLYVAMTRGRDGNFAYTAADPAADPDQHHAPRPQPSRHQAPQDQAFGVLAAALATSGAQDAAHTALSAARTRATAASRDVERQAAADRETQRKAAQAVPPEHAATAALLAQRRAERQQLNKDESQHWKQLHQARAELSGLPRWARHRRQSLTATISVHETALLRPIPAELDATIDQLTQRTEQNARVRNGRSNQEETHRLERAMFTRPAGGLSRPRPVSVASPTGQRGLGGRYEHDHGPQRSDDYGLSR